MTHPFAPIESLGIEASSSFQRNYTRQFAYGLYVKACGWSRKLAALLPADEFISIVLALDPLASQHFWRSDNIIDAEPLEARLAFSAFVSAMTAQNPSSTENIREVCLDLTASYILSSRSKYKAAYFCLNLPSPHWLGVSLTDDASAVDFWDLALDPQEFMTTFHVSEPWVVADGK